MFLCNMNLIFDLSVRDGMCERCGGSRRGARARLWTTAAVPSSKGTEPIMLKQGPVTSWQLLQRVYPAFDHMRLGKAPAPSPQPGKREGVVGGWWGGGQEEENTIFQQIRQIQIFFFPLGGWEVGGCHSNK